MLRGESESEGMRKVETEARPDQELVLLWSEFDVGLNVLNCTLESEGEKKWTGCLSDIVVIYEQLLHNSALFGTCTCSLFMKKRVPIGFQTLFNNTQVLTDSS